jgi:head-tail adaptor
MLNKRVAIMKRATEAAEFGKDRSYVYAGTVWAGVDYSRGTMSLREGALDAYDRLVIRMRYNKVIDPFCMVVYNGRTYQIESFNEDDHDNQIQLVVVTAPGKDLAGLIPPKPYSTSELGESPEGNI